MPLEKGSFMAVAFVRPSRSAVCGLVVALLAAVAGACGGAGEALKNDAAGLGGAVGTGGVGGMGGSVATDGGVPDKPSKQLGEPCTTPSECGSAQCVEGVCCNEACAKTCFTCKNPGTEGTCLPAFQGADPGDRCPTEAATTC